MRRESQSRLASRVRLPLRFEVLEDRVQPNDMMGLGLSLLTQWGTPDLGATVEQAELAPPAVQSDTGLVAEAQPAAAADFTAPIASRVERDVTPPAPVVEARGIDNVFALVNAQPTAPASGFEQAPVARPTQPLVELIRGLAAQQQGGAVSPLGATNVRALIAQQVNALVQAGQNAGGPGTQGGGAATVTDGTVTAQVTSAGRFGIALPAGSNGGLTFGGMGRVYEHFNYISINGVPREINATNCTVTLPIFNATPDVTVSQMDCGGQLVSFAHVAIGANNALYTVAVVDTQNSGCYYSYTDYDINSNPGGNAGVWSGALNEFQVSLAPNTFTYSNLLGDQTSWEQDEWDDLLLKLDGLASCTTLPNGPASHTGDWTGAFHWNVPAGETVMLYYHSRTA